MLEIGQMVMDGWRIEKRLGIGASSEVYLVSRDELGQHFERALKYIFLPFRKMLLECGGDQTRALEHWNRMLEETGREIRMQEQLSGTEGGGRIVRYFDHKVVLNHDNTECEIFILMERLTPLLDFLAEQNSGMSVAEVVRLGREVADALVVCHANGVFHCDVKEGNLFVADNGKFKLGDFGAAKYGRGQLELDSMRGTESYLPPEILNPDGKFELSASVDLYALGIVLYRLLNDLCSPFVNQGADEAQRTAATFKRASGAAVPPPAHAPDLLARVVLHALAAKPEQRFESAQEFSDALNQVMQELSAEQAGTIVCGMAAEDGRTRLIGFLTRALPTLWNTRRLSLQRKKKQWTTRGRVICGAVIGLCVLVGIGGTAVLRGYAQRAQDEYAQVLAEQQQYHAYLAQFDYEFSGADAMLTGYHGSDTEIQLPDELEGRKVTTICTGAFSESKVTAVIVPDTVTTIENGAFQDCRSLQSIVLPDSVTGIGTSAFAGCTALQEITLPVQTVRADAFSGCTALSEVRLAQNTQQIEARAFYGCSALEVVAIPKSVMQIGVDAFTGTSLTAVTVSRGCEYYKPNWGEQIWHWINQEDNLYSFPENCAVHYFE